MPKTIIPMRPDNFKTQLNQAEQTALTWLVLSGCSRDDAFLLFARPDMAGYAAKSVVKETIKQFFARMDVKEYIRAYTETLNELLNPKKKPVEAPTSASLEERKAKAKAKATEFAITLADNIDQADDPDFVLKLLDKVGILDSGEEVEEQPRRYLPVTCSECAYRKFVEENCEEVPDGTEFAEEKTDR